MNIQQLRYLVETADHGSMTAAAASLYVAQPALSRAVRALERELGVTVFARSAQGVEVTADGEVVVARARRVLRSLGALRRAADAAEAEAEGAGAPGRRSRSPQRPRCRPRSRSRSCGRWATTG